MNINQFNQKNFEKAVVLIKALNNPKRLMILCFLCDEELTVSELAERINLSLSPTSQHLAILREKGFVETKKEEQKVYYSLSSNEVKKVIGLLQELFCKK
jgi:DNA-binding transcriptional ArsR family regulator